MMNLNELYEEFIIEKESYCETPTIKYYNENLTKFINYIEMQAPHPQLTKENYIKYVKSLRTADIKNTSIRTYCRAVKVFSSWLLDNGYITEDFTKRVKLPRQDNAVIMPLTQKEVEKIDDYIIEVPFPDFIDLRNILIIHLMLDAGLRRSEVINLKKNDLDFDNKTITINNSKYNKSRILPMSNVIYNYSLAYLDECKYYLSDSIFFLMKEDGEMITIDTIKNIFRKLKKHVGIQRLHSHLLRHTFATSYLIQGGNLEQLRLFLGHSDYNVTRNYLHLAASNKLINYDIYKLDKNIIG